MMSPDEVIIFIGFSIFIVIIAAGLVINMIIDNHLQEEEYDNREDEFLRTQQLLHIKRKAEAETFHQRRRYRDRRIDDEQDSRDTNNNGC